MTAGRRGVAIQGRARHSSGAGLSSKDASECQKFLDVRCRIRIPMEDRHVFGPITHTGGMQRRQPTKTRPLVASDLAAIPRRWLLWLLWLVMACCFSGWACCSYCIDWWIVGY